MRTLRSEINNLSPRELLKSLTFRGMFNTLVFLSLGGIVPSFAQTSFQQESWQDAKSAGARTPLSHRYSNVEIEEKNGTFTASLRAEIYMGQGKSRKDLTMKMTSYNRDGNDLKLVFTQEGVAGAVYVTAENYYPSKKFTLLRVMTDIPKQSSGSLLTYETKLFAKEKTSQVVDERVRVSAEKLSIKGH